MVRNMVGRLVYVGQGKRPPEELLASRNRTLAAPIFAAAGLYLVGGYEKCWQLPVEENPFLPGYGIP
jgi:tRNA pseudouridine38-40 synthase